MQAAGERTWNRKSPHLPQHTAGPAQGVMQHDHMTKTNQCHGVEKLPQCVDSEYGSAANKIALGYAQLTVAAIFVAYSWCATDDSTAR